MRPKRWFWLAVALQVLVLAGMIGMHGYTLKTGKPVMLKTAPVDPWSPLMGQYVTLRYDISMLNEGKVTMEEMPYKRGETVYVLLQKGDPYWNAVAVSSVKLQAGSDQMVLRGHVEYSFDQQVSIRYGIEQFYVPEGQGPELEQHRDKMAVEVAVDSFGRGAVKSVFVDGKEIKWR